MKILLAIEEIGGGGKERRLVEHIKCLSEDVENDIHVVLTKNNIQYPEVIDLPISIHWINGSSILSSLFGYWRICKKIGPDIVHTWSFKSSFFFSLLGLFLSYGLVVGFIGDTFGHSGWRKILAEILVYRMADIVISNSESGLSAYEVPRLKGRVIYNGFDPIRLSRSSRNKIFEMGISTQYKVVMLANVSHNKNYSLFIEVAERITKIRNDVTFIAIGEILPQFDELVSPYAHGRHRLIRFLGFRSDVADLIKDCDIGVLCTYSEGISNAIIELMAAGLPVVTNDNHGGSKEIISHGVDGLIVPDNQVADSILYLLNDESARALLSRNAKEKISSRFSIMASKSAYYASYENALK